MKYVYAILTIVDNKPIMQTYLSDVSLTGRELLDKVVFTEEERRFYKNWSDEKLILADINKSQSLSVEIQEVEVK